jgi:hypothetical protein
MASQKTHILKALGRRRKAVDQHHAATIRKAGIEATRAELQAQADHAASLPGSKTTRITTKGTPQ